MVYPVFCPPRLTKAKPSILNTGISISIPDKCKTMKTGDIEITAIALKQLALFNLNNECSKVDSGKGAFNKHVNVHILDSFIVPEGRWLQKPTKTHLWVNLN